MSMMWSIVHAYMYLHLLLHIDRQLAMRDLHLTWYLYWLTKAFECSLEEIGVSLFFKDQESNF